MIVQSDYVLIIFLFLAESFYVNIKALGSDQLNK